MLVPIIKGLPIAETDVISALKEFDSEILNIVYNASNDIIQKMLIEEICRLKGFILENNIVA
jgi:hypothetical protein